MADKIGFIEDEVFEGKFSNRLSKNSQKMLRILILRFLDLNFGRSFSKINVNNSKWLLNKWPNQPPVHLSESAARPFKF